MYVLLSGPQHPPKLQVETLDLQLQQNMYVLLSGPQHPPKLNVEALDLQLRQNTYVRTPVRTPTPSHVASSENCAQVAS